MVAAAVAILSTAACGGGDDSIQDRAKSLDGDELDVFCTSGYRPDSFEALGLADDYDLTDADVDEWELAQDEVCP